MFLAGIPVTSNLVLELAARVKDAELARRLESDAKRDLIVVRLYGDERATVIKALSEPPPGLEAVRDALAEEQVRHTQDVLVAENAA